MADDVIEWIGLREALNLLQPSYTDRASAANGLKDHAAGDGIATIAGRAVELTNCGFMDSGGNIATSHEDWPIPASVWSSVPVAYTHSLTAWETGALSANTGYDKAVRLSGIRVDRSGIAALRTSVGAPSVVSPARQTGSTPAVIRHTTGRKRKGEWDDWIAYLSLCVAEGEIFGNTKQADALKAIAERMAKDEIDEMPRSTVQSAMARVLEMFRAYNHLSAG